MMELQMDRWMNDQMDCSEGYKKEQQIPIGWNCKMDGQKNH